VEDVRVNVTSGRQQETNRPTAWNKKGQFMNNRTLVSLGALRPVAWAALTVLVLISTTNLRAEDKAREPSLPSPLCDSLQVPDGSEVHFHAYAIGVQIYRWNGTSWVFIAPAAMLFADAGYHGQVGIHYAGPTWESNSGSKVVGTRLAACTPDPNSIPWLKLSGVSSGPGVLDGTTFVQRINTVGGKAPSTPGTTVGQEAQVPYTAEYVFYRSTD
jgi:hypothetical protein